MNNKTIVTVVAVLALSSGLLFFWPTEEAKGKLDDFAQCLADKEIIMYGAAWCSHCQSEKAAFGDSFKYIHYVECPENPKECLTEGIDGYPTWIFPDGRRFVGEQGINKLSEKSGCVLPVE